MLTCIAEVKQYLALTTCTAIVNPKDAQMGYQKKKVKEYNGSWQTCISHLVKALLAGNSPRETPFIIS